MMPRFIDRVSSVFDLNRCLPAGGVEMMSAVIEMLLVPRRRYLTLRCGSRRVQDCRLPCSVELKQCSHAVAVILLSGTFLLLLCMQDILRQRM
jgi:hypothetical protein